MGWGRGAVKQDIRTWLPSRNLPGLRAEPKTPGKNCLLHRDLKGTPVQAGANVDRHVDQTRVDCFLLPVPGFVATLLQLSATS